MLRPPTSVGRHPELLHYWRNVVSPIICGRHDDERLAELLDGQRGAWERAADGIVALARSPERDHDYRHALAVIKLLTKTVKQARRRIQAGPVVADIVKDLKRWRDQTNLSRFGTDVLDRAITEIRRLRASRSAYARAARARAA
jgi:hypothetical protein